MKLLNPKRLVVFVVNKVPLAYQQCHYLREETCLHAVVFCGESIREIYYQDICSYDVIILTAQVFLNYLSSGQISLSRISCIVFDEVHNASGSHPFALFFETYYDDFCDQEKPMLMTLSASPLELECEPERSLFKLNELCSLVWCDIYTPIVFLKDMYSYCALPTPYYYVIPVNPFEISILQSIDKYILRLFRKYHSILGISSANHLPDWSSTIDILSFLASFDNNTKLTDSTLHLINYPWIVKDTKILKDLILEIRMQKQQLSNRFIALEEFLSKDDALKIGSKVYFLSNAEEQLFGFRINFLPTNSSLQSGILPRNCWTKWRY